MSVIQPVTKGQPIRATWANSLVHEVNTKQGLLLGGRYTYSHYNMPSSLNNDSAWQIRYNCGKYSLNAGQIYINGHLVTNGHKENTVNVGEGDAAQTMYVNSYNMYSSCKNWYEKCNYTPTDSTDVPVWFITLIVPKETITKDNITQVVANLVVTNDEKQVPQAEGIDDNQEFIVIQLNKVEDNHVIQLISGTIHLYEPIPSLVAGDGIKIIEVEDNILEISCSPSVIADVDIDIIGGQNVNVQQTINGTTREFTISATDNNTIISIVAGDGITVAEKDNTYTISCIDSVIHYDFDQQWFIVTDGVVTLNEQKINQVAQEIANNAMVNVNVTGIVDQVVSGRVQVNTTGLSDGENGMDAGTTVGIV